MKDKKNFIFVAKLKRIIQYPNGIELRRKNAKMRIGKLKNEEYIIESTIISDDLSPRAIHGVLRNKAVSTGIKYSKEGMLALYYAMTIQLKKDGLI